MGGFLLMALFALFFFGFAAWLIRHVLDARQQALAATTWGEARCTILGSSHKLVRRNNQTKHVPVVRYEYEIGGQSYKGERITFFDRGLDDRSGQIIGRYPVGGTASVRYNPSKPSLAVLEPSAAGTGMWIVAAVVMAAIGLGFLAAGANLWLSGS